MIRDKKPVSVVQTFEPHANGEADAPPPGRSVYICPPDLLLRARRHGPVAVAVAAAEASDVLQSVCWAASFGLVDPILVGEPAAIERGLRQHGVMPVSLRIVPAVSEAEAARLAVGLVARGEARLLMKGHLHTDVLMRAVLDRTHGIRSAGRRLSHVFVMRRPGAARDLLITDAALNVLPDAATMMHIARHAMRVAKIVGIAHPRIAMLSASETANAAMQSSIAAAAFADDFRAEATAADCSIAGPLALDVALSPEAAALKGMAGHEVAGRADILVVPNIETGNALFKAMVHLAHATAIGVVLGASVPIVLTSRADPMEAKLASVALAQILSPQGAEAGAAG